MANYPYYTEPTHDRGTVTIDSSNAARSTATSSAEGRLVVDAVDKIHLLEPNKHPLVSLLNNVGKVYDGKSWKGSGMLKASAGNPEFSWFEDFYGGRYAKVVGTVATGAVTITVSGAGSSSAHIFTKGDVVKNARTGENFVIATVASTTTVTAGADDRSFGTTAEVAMADGDGLYIVGNVNEENAGARNVNATRSSKESNYTQIFKTSIAVSGTEKEAHLYGGKDLPYQRAKKGTEHALDIERAFWWGEKKSDTTGTMGHPRRATGGVLEFINSNNAYVQNQGGVLTAPDFNTFLREGFTYGDDTKFLFAGGVVLQAINEFARGQIQMRPLEKSYGMNISTYVTPFGKINIVHNPLFVEDYAGYGFLLDMSCFKYRYMNNRDTKLKTNIQANDTDGQVDEYMTECGLQRIQANKCALIKGVTA